MASLVAQMVKASAYNVVRSLGGEDPPSAPVLAS